MGKVKLAPNWMQRCVGATIALPAGGQTYLISQQYALAWVHIRKLISDGRDPWAGLQALLQQRSAWGWVTAGKLGNGNQDMLGKGKVIACECACECHLRMEGTSASLPCRTKG